jgi:hypothetical protein
MSISVSNASSSPISARTFQPGGTETDRQVKETSDKTSRTEQKTVTPSSNDDSTQSSRTERGRIVDQTV